MNKRELIDFRGKLYLYDSLTEEEFSQIESLKNIGDTTELCQKAVSFLTNMNTILAAAFLTQQNWTDALHETLADKEFKIDETH